jgi:hypothetical protein
MDARPRVETWICTRIGAEAPNDKFLSVRRALENVRVVAVETAFQLNCTHPAAVQSNDIIVPVGLARDFPFFNVLLVLHVVQDIARKFPFRPHGSGKLASRTLNRTSEKSAIVKLFLTKPVIAQLMGFRF